MDTPDDRRAARGSRAAAEADAALMNGHAEPTDTSIGVGLAAEADAALMNGHLEWLAGGQWRRRRAAEADAALMNGHTISRVVNGPSDSPPRRPTRP